LGSYPPFPVYHKNIALHNKNIKIFSEYFSPPSGAIFCRTKKIIYKVDDYRTISNIILNI